MTLFSLKSFLLSLLVTAGISIAAARERTILGPEQNRLDENVDLRIQHNCRLNIFGDGNFHVERRILGIDNEPNEWKTSWSTGVEKPEDGEYALKLTEDGNLELINEDRDRVAWSTNIEGDTTNKFHELVIDGACRIKLQWDGEDVWENIKTSPFEAGQVLQRGDMFRMQVNFESIPEVIEHPFSLNYILALQHDCNLVQSVGTDHADEDSAVWDSGTNREDGGTFDSSLGFGDERPDQLWSTPPGWLDESDNSDQIQEGYQLVLDSDGTVFHWSYCEDGDDCDAWEKYED
jgi:hypothetical protein